MANHSMVVRRVVLVALLACVFHAAQAGKVIISTTPIGKRHMMNLKKIATEIEQRGNTVMVIPFASQKPESTHAFLH